MGLFSLFEPSNSECQCPTAVRNDPNRSYKERRSFRDRVEMVTEIREKHPTKIPIIVERFRNEKILPLIDKVRYIVPEDMTWGMVTSMIRKRLSVDPYTSVFLFTSEAGGIRAGAPKIQPTFVRLNDTMDKIYRENKDEDGLLYIEYTSQEAFGS